MGSLISSPSVAKGVDWRTWAERLADGDQRAAREELLLASLAVGVYDVDGWTDAAIRAGWYSAETRDCARGGDFGVARHPEVIAIAVTGSEEPVDWFRDMMIVPRIRWSPPLDGDRVALQGQQDFGKFQPVRVGWGLRTQAAGKRFMWSRRPAKPILCEAVLHEVREWLSFYGTADVLLTGHSLGGALTGLLAAYLCLHGHRPAVSMSFNGPRPGNRGWRDYAANLGVPFYLSVNSVKGTRDVVSRHPLRWPTGARHHGIPVVHGGKDGLEVFVGADAWKEHRRLNPRSSSRFLSNGAVAHLGAPFLEMLRRRID